MASINETDISVAVSAESVGMETSLKYRDKVGVQDAVLLEDYTNEDEFVLNLKKRFKENIIYTYIGQVLVSVNPYKELHIYTPANVKEYRNKHFYEVPPHIFAITDTAYRSLRQEGRDQCILISGESGSGKTEASKKVLQYIAEVTEHRGEVEKVKDKLLQSNPVLEAFGNAKTNRNDNSSRFGKFMDVQFNFKGNPTGGAIINYLLEKSRVICQAPGERNFHIFYQFLAGANNDELEKYQLKRNLDNYYYLTNGMKGKNTEDQKSFAEVRTALKITEFSDDEQDDMFNIIASILNLGNTGFSEIESKAHISKTEGVETVSKLLGCDIVELKNALTYRTIDAQGDVITTPLNRELAIYARDALAKAVYDRLFTWIVQRLNKSLQPIDTNRKNAVMGILDIYGFEIFGKNSFEQLCINFCNEKLQQLFIELTLKSEQEEYKKEGIEWQHIDYFDNKIICDLIEEKHKGIISLMDEECLRPGDTTDATLLAKMNKSLDKHQHYISHQKADKKMQKIMGRDEFQLIHYAGAVTYNVNGFIEKNNDLLFRDLREVMSKSSNGILKSVFLSTEQNNKKRPETAISQFKNSLNNLMVILMDKQPSYIRCIKPNDRKLAGVFDVELVRHQVKYLGLMENLRVRRAGFAYRRVYEQFLERYKCLAKGTWPNYRGSAKDGVQLLVTALEYGSDEYQMGKTKIFIRIPKTLFRTEDAFQLKKHDIATILQAQWKGYSQRKKYRKMKHSAVVIQKWVRRYLAQKAAEKRRHAVRVIRRFINGFITRNGPVTEDNKAFLEMAKSEWLRRLSKTLPKSLLDRKWPIAPHVCQEASALLEKYYAAHLSRVYRLNLSPERKAQFELKVLAEKLFAGKKKSYKASIPEWFVKSRVNENVAALKQNFVINLQNGETEIYATSVMKYDRHGYKPRERILVVTNTSLYVLEANKTIKQKHCLPLDKISFLVTQENDRFLMVKIPIELMKKDKGDLILEVPHLIEFVTKIIDVTKNPGMLSIYNKNSIEHNVNGKQGIIDVTIGNPERIHKDKSGHLLIVASP